MSVIYVIIVIILQLFDSGIWRYTATFVISTLLVVLAAIFLLISSILWSTVIRQAKSINDVRSVSVMDFSPIIPAHGRIESKHSRGYRNTAGERTLYDLGRFCSAGSIDNTLWNQVS